ncbi:dinitrogenase iron-molybdenum cofactor biosynthesis protein [Thermodesulfobacterium sp. TA1]|uniref:NifB/NifX family molybdenum-iron cluster-binding protein n=1 Tax=Thermodesulfobacterium sp. TA1 TaxID=2234087 RepID=UPI0012324AEC|nr:NifB/NifX family molybdenum-iron cluster-binding protein [Thermodesulfobacterium sp. TA1]QER41641.1 dinitrogenase iron-molybdenum cofactor biosynthesis protein [Thermodesulfobacterium sp. TA1]
MKICITSQGKELGSEIDPRFGRCKYFIFYDTETDQYEAVENRWREAAQGAGTQAGQFVASKGVSVLITGKIGPGAERVIKAAGIKVIEAQGMVIDAINKVKQG